MRCLQLRSLDETPHRRGQFLFDEARQRTRQHHAEPDRIDHPPHDVQRTRPCVLGGSADAQFSRGRTGAQHGSGCTVAEKCRGDHIGFRAAVDPARQRAQLHDDHEDNLVRFGTRKPCAERQSGHSAGATATEHRHAHRGGPKPHLRRDARFNARRGDARRGHRDDHIDVTRGDARLVKCCARRLHEQFARALEIDVGAFGEIVRLAEPLERAHGIAPIDPDIDENIGEFRIAHECAGIGVRAAPPR